MGADHELGSLHVSWSKLTVLRVSLSELNVGINVSLGEIIFRFCLILNIFI